jgi:alpha-2-macroglobulin
VLRHAPEGEVPLAPHVSVTFSQAMVDLGSVGDVAGEAVPVRLTPQPAGRWRWVGTRTLLFEPEGGSLPMATEYTVEVPAGTRAAVGGTLDEAVRWRFATPALTLRDTGPAGGSVALDAVIFADFDQRIDPDALLAALQVRTGRGPAPVLRLASAAEVAADEDVAPRARAALPGRWLALRPAAPLPADASITLVLPAGTAGAEGPRRTADDQQWSFRTYGPLRFAGLACEYRKARCRPGVAWTLTFSNPLDGDAFRSDMVQVSPPLDGLSVDVDGPVVWLHGRAQARTTYTVTFAAALRDAFGQSLGQPLAVPVTTGEMTPQVRAPAGRFVVVDPSAPPRFSVWSAGYPKLRVRAAAVEPSDWPRYAQAEKRNLAERLGRVVLDTTVPVLGSPDQLVETRVALAGAFRAAGVMAGGRNLLVDVEGVRAPPPPSSQVEVVAYALPQRARTWVQSTGIGLSAVVDDVELLGWATRLSDGTSLPGADLRLLGADVGARTDVQGVVRLPLTAAGAFGLLARHGGDVAFLPAHWTGSWGERSWKRTDPGRNLRWAVFDDRTLYRPGEEARVKGWVRVEGQGRGGDLEPWSAPVEEVSYTLADERSIEVARGTAPVNAWGGFDLSLPLPRDMNLGLAKLILSADGWGGEEHRFMVQEFRRPEFSVTAAASQAPHFAGGTATVTAQARYYTGGALAEAPVAWRAQAVPAEFRPAGRPDFAFGRAYGWSGPEEEDGARVRELEARTDGEGRSRLRLDFEGAERPLAYSVLVSAGVSDVNRQRWEAPAALLVHPAEVYVGVRQRRLFVERGAPFTVDLIATDLDGAAVGGRPIEVVAERVLHQWRGRRTVTEVVEAGRCVLTSGAEVVSCTVTPAEGGAYRLRATVRDTRGRASLSEARFWVAGGPLVSARGVEREAVTLVPDRQSYAGGDTAEVLVVSPIVPAEALLSVSRSGVVRRERFHLSSSTATVRVPIDEAMVPGVQVQVDVVGRAARADAPGRVRPAFASGSVGLAVPPFARRLAVRVAPRAAALAPGGSTTLDVELKDAAGRPVAQGEVAVAVVDEAVLALAERPALDPVGAFYPARATRTVRQDLRGALTLDQAALTAAQLEAMLSELSSLSATSSLRTTAVVEAGPAAPAFDGAPVRLRRAFTPLALFAASVATDDAGRAQVPLTVPDSLTRYRVVALAATRGTEFGAGESTLTVRLPLMARPSPPRFLSYGDQLELPVVVENQSDAARTVDVAVRAQGLTPTGGAGRRVNVPARGRAEVRFPMAVRDVGTARLQVAADGGGDADAAEVTLPVLTPATLEAFATYGTLDAGAVAQPVRPPAGAITVFGGLEVTGSSTALHALTDAVLYLVSYPYECSEQLASRVLALAALRDVLSAFRAPGLPSAAELEGVIARDLRRLAALQNDDGGFAFWRRGEPSWPYLSIHVALALERARAKGFKLPYGTLSMAHDYLKTIERHIPKDYPPSARQALVAYALNVRQRLGDHDFARGRALVNQAGVEGLSFESLGWLLPVVTARVEGDAIRRRLANGVTETAGAAHFAETYREAGPHLLLASDRRTDAVVLEALIGDQPRSDLIPKLVEGLLAHRTAGRWRSTQENVFVLLALDRYFEAYEKVEPDFVARAWLGDRLLGEQEFRGRSALRHEVDVPMAELAAGGRRTLVLAKEGAGRLYYRLGLRYAPGDLRLGPLDAGFALERRYEAVDDAGDVRRGADGTWHVRAGARVRVRLAMAAEGQRAHVALVDTLPAGLEVQNPVLAAAARAPEDDHGQDAVDRPWGSWFEHQNLRDERVEAFTSRLEAGVYAYSYVTRATTPGTFVAAPARAEEMYHPETFGRTGTDRVVIEVME